MYNSVEPIYFECKQNISNAIRVKNFLPQIINMKLDKIVGWYQKKIGTYDKQQWEKTVEQRILNRYIQVPLKNTKLKTELIDVDLVRGSSFPKLKPKQSLLTVLRLAVLRFILLPIYAKWWVEQTSPKICILLLVLYLLQMLNWAIYSCNIHKTSEHIVPVTELLIPMAMSLFLSFIHSQIVATASNSSSSDKRKRVPHPNRKKRERVRRKKKVNRVRSSIDAKIPTSCESVDRFKAFGSVYPRNNFQNNNENNANKFTSYKNTSLENLQNTEKLKRTSSYTDSERNSILSNDLNQSPTGLRKRNVNWDSPLKSRLINSNNKDFNEASCSHNLITTKNQIVKTVEPVLETNKILNIVQNQENVPHNIPEPTGDDDGFESLNGKSSSGEDNTGINLKQLGAVLDELKMKLDNSTTNTRFSKRNICSDSIETILHTDSDTDTLKGAQLAESDSKNKLNDEVKETMPLLTKSAVYAKNAYRLVDNDSDKCSAYRNKLNTKTGNADSTDTDEEDDDGETVSSPGTSNPHFTEATTSATEWIGITTNSEDCSYSSEIDHSASPIDNSENGGEYDFAPNVILNPSYGTGDRINCTIWDGREAKKAEMSVLDISSAIIDRVEAMPETCDYVYIGVVMSITLALIPPVCRLCEAIINSSNSTDFGLVDLSIFLFENTSYSYEKVMQFAFGDTSWEKTVLMVSLKLRLCLTFLIFFLLAVAERTFKQRFLYAKLFSHLTSSRRARKSEVPHFRLNKVRNIKIWLSVRSYLKRRGPQRSVDMIVSASFVLTLIFLVYLSVEWLKGTVRLHAQYNMEALIWACALACFMLRFVTLGTKINRKYRSMSVLITEQINLYLQIEQKPHKKEELMLSNCVLKLAADLLKELESPYKISGLSANPYLYTTVKVVICSALSGVLTEMLGFKLKLHQIKIK